MTDISRFEHDNNKLYAHGGLKIFKFQEITVRIDWVWFILLFGTVIWRLMHSVTSKEHSDALSVLIVYLIAYPSILVHEFGHAIAAKKFGVRTKNILITWFGGVANLERIVLGKEEFWITLWGPLMNVFIVLVAILIQRITSGYFFSPYSHQSFLDLVMVVNTIILVFNMIPAWPMDGGRLFRSLIWALTRNDAKSTLIATRFAQFFGALFIVASYWQGFVLGIIGIIVILTSSAELKECRDKENHPQSDVEEAEDDTDANFVNAPWTDEQVKSLNAYQNCRFFHPFTGKNGRILIATNCGWIEDMDSDVSQTWAHTFMSDWSWKAAADTQESLYGSMSRTQNEYNL